MRRSHGIPCVEDGSDRSARVPAYTNRPRCSPPRAGTSAKGCDDKGRTAALHQEKAPLAYGKANRLAVKSPEYMPAIAQNKDKFAYNDLEFHDLWILCAFVYLQNEFLIRIFL